MSFQNDDLLLVNRAGTSFKTEYGLLRERIIEGVGGATVSETEPTGEHEGDLWYQPSTDSLFVWVGDAATGAWEPAGAGGDFLPLAGGNLTGGVTQTEVAITASDFDLSAGNFFSAGAITIPSPTNGVNGQSGLIRITDSAVSFTTGVMTNIPTAVTAPAIIPFYVESDTVVRLGDPVEVA